MTVPRLRILSGGLGDNLSVLPLFRLESRLGRYLPRGHRHCSFPDVLIMNLEHRQVSQLPQGHLRDPLEVPCLYVIHPLVVVLTRKISQPSNTWRKSSSVETSDIPRTAFVFLGLFASINIFILL